MGCGSSKTSKSNVDNAKFFDAEGNPKVTPEAAVFMRLANEDNHPVARRLFEEWAFFVYAHTSTGNDVPAALVKRPTTFVCTTEGETVTHASVDEVGKSFLDYLAMDLRHRGWGGAFDYGVDGVDTQGQINVNVDLTMNGLKAQWKIKGEYAAHLG